MTPIETRVESVTLYHRGATVRRTASLDFAGGLPSELFLAGLPLSLVDHTVRLRVEGEGGQVMLSNVRVGLFAPPRGTPPIAPEQKELQRVQDALALLADRIEQIDSETERLVAVNVLARPAPEEGKMPPPAPMVARVALETLFEESVGKRIELTRQLRDEVKALEEKERALHRAIQLASTAHHVKPDELRKSIHASLVASPSTPPGMNGGRLVLEYFVVGARWAPSYQCRMSRDCLQADLQLRALVCQRTGEDWRGVMLQLSTASPMSWTEVPELGAIKIGKAQPPPPSQRGFRPPPKGAASLFLDYDRGSSSARAALPVIPSWQPPSLDEQVIPGRLKTSLAMGSAGAMHAESESDAGPPMEEERELKKELAPMRPALAPPAPPPAMAALAPMMAPGAGGAPRPKMAKSARSRDEGAELDSLSEQAAPELEVVLYASLRLSGPESISRGSLTAVDRRQAFIESLTRLNLVAPFDVLALVERAEAQGQDVYSVRAPEGSSDVRSAAGWYDYVYGTDAAVDVPSDGTFHSVPVNTRTASSDVLYVVVPREDIQVYRQAQVRNPLASPLLPGPVEVSVGGEYVLTTTLPSVAPGVTSSCPSAWSRGSRWRVMPASWNSAAATRWWPPTSSFMISNSRW